MAHHQFRVEGMTCSGCVAAVRNVLSRQPGVSTANVEIGKIDLELDRVRRLRRDIRRGGREGRLRASSDTSPSLAPRSRAAERRARRRRARPTQARTRATARARSDASTPGASATAIVPRMLIRATRGMVSASAAARTSSDASATDHSPGLAPAESSATETSAAPSAGIVRGRMAEHRDEISALGERANLRAAIGPVDLGSQVLDVERARDRFARLARLAGEEHGLDACIMQLLDGRARAGAKPVLQRDDADDFPRARDEQHAAPLRLVIAHEIVRDRDAHFFGEEKHAAAEDDAFALRVDGRRARAGVHGVAHALRADVARARRSQDGRGERDASCRWRPPTRAR